MKEKHLTEIICTAISANAKIIVAVIAALVALAVPTYIIIVQQKGGGDSGSSSLDSANIISGSNPISEPASESDSETVDSKIPVSIEFDANGGNININSTVVYYGEKYGDLPEPQKNNYDFKGWYTEGGDPIYKDTDVTNRETHTLYAHWNEITISVSLNANGGNVIPKSVDVILGGTYNNLPTPQWDNYIFDGWYTSANGGGLVNSSTKVENSSPDTLYAHWKPRTIKVMLNANGGNITPDSITVYYGKDYGSLPVPKRDNYSFKGWYTQINGGSLIKNDTMVEKSETHTLYAHWEQNTTSVSFDANGGIVNTNYIAVLCGEKYGSLPIPQRDYYTFGGWYTASSGGSLVESNTVVGNAAPHTLYAHWKQNDISGWVLSSEVPHGAEIVDQKWLYTKTETKESHNSSEAGWTQVGSYWKLTDSGTNTYAKFPTNSNDREYYNTSDVFYKKYNVAEYTSYETSNEKREVSGGQINSYIYYHWVYPLTGNHSETDRIVGNYKNEWINDGGYTNIWESFENGYIEYNSRTRAYEARGHSTYSYWWIGRLPVYTQNYTDYIKMYQYKRELALESATEIVAGGNISNVQRYVKYRPR